MNKSTTILPIPLLNIVTLNRKILPLPMLNIVTINRKIFSIPILSIVKSGSAILRIPTFYTHLLILVDKGCWRTEPENCSRSHQLSKTLISKYGLWSVLKLCVYHLYSLWQSQISGNWFRWLTYRSLGREESRAAIRSLLDRESCSHSQNVSCRSSPSTPQQKIGPHSVSVI